MQCAKQSTESGDRVVPVHRTCYRCGVPVRALVNRGDVLGGMWGCCDDCDLRLDAAMAWLNWHLSHPAVNEGEDRA